MLVVAQVEHHYQMQQVVEDALPLVLLLSQQVKYYMFQLQRVLKVVVQTHKHLVVEEVVMVSVVLEAVQENGDALKFASPRLKGDRVVVLTAVKQRGYTLRHASKQLRGDREVVLAAVKQNGFALKCVPEQLRGEAVTLQSEVYQLGTLLYRLLCNVPPFRLDDTSPMDLMRIVCEVTPECPSRRWRMHARASMAAYCSLCS